MTSSSRLRPILEQIPFSLDDTDAVNAAFHRWKVEEDATAKKHVDLWTYCFIWRYFLVKDGQGSIAEAADLDDLIARAYEKVQYSRSDVEKASRYASWVSVVCKNTFLNYARKDRVAQSIDDEEAPQIPAEEEAPIQDAGYVRQAIEEAIQRLPEYLQETARLYFLEKCSFKEIAEVIGKSVATARTYKFKAVKRLREDEHLQDLT